MAKKVSWDNLPQMVGKLLEILSSEDSEHSAIPEIRERLILLERKIDDLNGLIAPDRPVMDLPAVCRVLKIKPKEAYELAQSGALPYKTVGRKTLFYEDGVVKRFMSLPVWKSAISTSAAAETVAEADAVPVEYGDDQQIDIKAAAAIVERSAASLYQLTSNKRIPFHKDGKKVYFIVGELREWIKDNPPRGRKRK